MKSMARQPHLLLKLNRNKCVFSKLGGFVMTARILMCFAAICAFGCGTIEQSVSTSISPYDIREIEKISVSCKYSYTFPNR